MDLMKQMEQQVGMKYIRWRQAGYIVSFLLAAILLGAGLYVYSESDIRDNHAISWISFLPMVAMAYGSLLLLAVAVIEVRVRHARAGTLDRLAAYLTDCQEEERHELSSRLHDDVGASLATLKMEIETLRRRCKQCGNPEGWDRADLLLQHLLDEVRGLSALLYPRMIGSIGLRYAIQEMVDRVCGSGFDVQLNLEDVPVELGPERSLCALRTVQEAVINVRRHAQATRIAISLSIHGASLSGAVEDNGKGWRNAAEGMGMTLIRERLRKLGGQLSLSHSELGGACVRFDIPMQEPQELKRQQKKA